MRYPFAILIMLSVIPLASMILPSALSQSYTTHATTLTTVTQQTFTYAASTPVASYTATSSEAQTLVATSATNTGVSRYYCIISGAPFNAQAAQPVQGTITLSQATAPVSIQAFILSDQSFAQWQHPTSGKTTCDPNDAGVTPEWKFGLPQPQQSSNLTVNWTPSANGKYWIIAGTYSGGTVVVTFNLASQAAQTVTSVSYSTSATLTVLMLTQTLTSVISEPLSQAPAGLGVNGELLIGAGIVIAVGCLAAYYILKRRK